MHVSCRTANSQSISKIPRFHGRLDSRDSRFTKGMNYDPDDVVLSWTLRDTLIVAHVERYSSYDVFGATCAGSGIVAVPAAGGISRPLALGKPVCDAVLTSDGVAIDPSISW